MIERLHHAPASTVLELPTDLIQRLKLGREEFVQRLLTTLILDGPYPRWNTRSTPSATGFRFLADLYERTFGRRWPGDDAVFVDEFELRPRHDSERGGAPDWALLWDDRIWLIELKTEKGSHRVAQIPSYFELAHHYFPDAAIDLLYLTGPMTAPYEPIDTWAAYAHTTWIDVAPIIEHHWPADDTVHGRVADGVLRMIDDVRSPASGWRERFLGRPAPAGEPIEPAAPAPSPQAATDVTEEALATATATANDGAQRAVDVMVADLDELLAIRLELRTRLSKSPPDSALRNVVPWIWSTTSGGRPMTEMGRQYGMELRVSRYRSPQYGTAPHPNNGV